MSTIAATTRDYGGFDLVACPVCGETYSHIQRVFTRTGTDSTVYDGTRSGGRLKPKPPYVIPEDRSCLVVEFWGECEHEWEWQIQQHKGMNILSVVRITSAKARAERRAWRKEREAMTTVYRIEGAE